MLREKRKERKRIGVDSTRFVASMKGPVDEAYTFGRELALYFHWTPCDIEMFNHARGEEINVLDGKHKTIVLLSGSSDTTPVQATVQPTAPKEPSIAT